MSKLKPSAAKKARHTAYKITDKVAKNAKRKLERHLKKHPNDVQGAEALKKGLNTTRTKPNNRLGWVSESLKTFQHPTPPSRHVTRDFAQILAFVRKISRTSRTKEEQVTWRKILEAQEKSKQKNKKD